MPALANIQFLLIAVIATLTGLLAFIGFQVILILKEVHGAAKKLNAKEGNRETTFGMLKKVFSNKQIQPPKFDEEKFTDDVQFHPNTDTRISASPYLSILQEYRQNEEKGLETEAFSHITALQERGRQSSSRVFHRNGKPLT